MSEESENNIKRLREEAERRLRELNKQIEDKWSLKDVRSVSLTREQRKKLPKFWSTFRGFWPPTKKEPAK